MFEEFLSPVILYERIISYCHKNKILYYISRCTNFIYDKLFFMNNGSIYEGMMGGMWLKQKKGNGIPQIFKFPHLKIADFFKFFCALIY